MLRQVSSKSCSKTYHLSSRLLSRSILRYDDQGPLSPEAAKKRAMKMRAEKSELSPSEEDGTKDQIQQKEIDPEIRKQFEENLSKVRTQAQYIRRHTDDYETNFHSNLNIGDIQAQDPIRVVEKLSMEELMKSDSPQIPGKVQSELGIEKERQKLAQMRAMRYGQRNEEDAQKLAALRANDMIAFDSANPEPWNTTLEKKYHMDGTLKKRDHVNVNHLEGITRPYLADASPYGAHTALGQYENKQLLEKHKTLSDPIWHLTQGRYAIDSGAQESMMDWEYMKMRKWQLYAGVFYFFLFVKIMHQQWSKPDEEYIENTLVSKGHLHFEIENEIAMLTNKFSETYGQTMMKSVTYRKVLKSECLKKYGLEKGTQIFEELIYSITGSYDLAHKATINSRDLKWYELAYWIPNL